MTDFWAGAVTRQLPRLLSNKLSRSLAARCHPQLPSRLVKSWNLRAFSWEVRLRRMTREGGVVGRHIGYCELGRRFARAVRRFLKARRSLPENSIFFGYDTASLEVMEYLRECGVVCIVDQMDPCRVEFEMVRAEQGYWPGWEDCQLDVPKEFYERRLREWDIATRVVVNSEFSRRGLMQQGVPEEKIVVIPLSFELPASENGSHSKDIDTFQRKIPNSFTCKDPFRILFLGQVMLRKGIQYLVEAARILQHEPVRFDIVGPIHITEGAVSSVPSNIIFHGRATRDQVIGWYRRSHIFVLPTLSDGFAITQIEAMANGLPVIATPNCGAVVSDSVDGFIVPPRDPEALACAIHYYLEEPNCLECQHHAALRKSKQFRLEQLGRDLVALGRELHGQSN